MSTPDHAPDSGSPLAAIHGDMFRLLHDFHAFCEARGIHYSLHGGTLLGALRYADFIPWDDDLDISIARRDYERLLAALEADPAFVVDMRGTWTPRLSAPPADGNPVTLDLFIWDYISEKKAVARLKILLLAFAQGMMHKSFEYARKYPFSKNVLLLFAWLSGRLLPFRPKLRLYVWLSRHFAGQRRFVHRSNDNFASIAHVFPAKAVEEFVSLPIRNGHFQATSAYKDVLTKSYGPDFMTPPPATKQVPRHIARKEA